MTFERKIVHPCEEDKCIHGAACMWTHPPDIEVDVCAVWQQVAAGAVDLGGDALSLFLGDELLIRLNPSPYCRPSPLPLPLIPFRERTEAWRTDVNTCALTHTRAHTSWLILSGLIYSRNR